MCRLQGGIRPTFLLGWALVFRLTAFCMDPLFSDDLYRYRWEGRVAAAGLNPYDHRPAGPGLGALLEERVDGKDFKPVYGPLLETLQWGLVVLGGGSLLAMKLGACLAELGLCWLLWQWVEEKWRWMAWGWCPLGIVEFWGMGHHDAVMAALAVGAPLDGVVPVSALPVDIGRESHEQACGLSDARTEAERQAIVRALTSSAGNCARAARALGLSRQGLQKAMRRQRA